jgi:hypothetical protein
LAALREYLELLEERSQAADTGANYYPNPVAVLIGYGQPGIFDSLEGRCQGELGEAVHPPGFASAEQVYAIEPFNFSRNASFVLAGIIMGDRPYTGVPGHQVFP